MKAIIDDYFDSLKNTLDKLSRSEIDNFANLIISAKENDKNIFIMGNGGSALTASHFVCDLNKDELLEKDEKRFKFICLNDNLSIMMAYSNDLSYEDIFIEQLKNFLKPEDLVIALSGSGNSKNIIKAVDYANKVGAITIGLTGHDGGKLKQIVKHGVHVGVSDMQISEDVHLILCHLLRKMTGKNGNKLKQFNASII